MMMINAKNTRVGQKNIQGSPPKNTWEKSIWETISRQSRLCVILRKNNLKNMVPTGKRNWKSKEIDPRLVIVSTRTNHTYIHGTWQGCKTLDEYFLYESTRGLPRVFSWHCHEQTQCVLCCFPIAVSHLLHHENCQCTDQAKSVFKVNVVM